MTPPTQVPIPNAYSIPQQPAKGKQKKHAARVSPWRSPYKNGGAAHAFGMFKRILIAALTAVCLAAALLVLYNCTAEVHAPRVARFLAVRAEAPSFRPPIPRLPKI